MANWAIVNVHDEIAELHRSKEEAYSASSYVWGSSVIRLRVWHRVGDAVRHNSKCEIQNVEPDTEDWEVREPLNFD